MFWFRLRNAQSVNYNRKEYNMVYLKIILSFASLIKRFT